jgi:hypothetical protein
MEREQFEQLVKLVTELNQYLESISSSLHSMDNTLDLIKDEIRGQKGKAHFRT